ncbi:MAG TPA: HDIG domain-containing protein [Candidatus Acidoferrum sp.]|nr:HDIG domain-containing protein [Candidatus Acidoferrum sp.]
MFSFLLRIKRKIKKVLKVHSESRRRYVPTTRSRVIKTLILVVTSMLIALVYPGEDLFSPLDVPRAGETAHEDIIAPFQITVLKSPRELNDEKEMIRVAIPYVIDDDSAISNGAYRSLNAFIAVADSLRQQLQKRGGPSADVVARSMAQRFPFMSEVAIGRTLQGDENLELMRLRLTRIYDEDIYKIGVLQDLAALPESRLKTVLIREGDKELIYQRDRLLDIPTANARLLTSLNRLAATDTADVEYYYLIGRNFIQPNLRIDMAEYNRRVDENIELVSNVKEVVNAGDIIVRSGRKVGDREEAILREMAQMMHGQAIQQNPLTAYLPLLARILLILAAFSTLYLALFYLRPDMFRSNPKLLALFTVFIMQLFLIWLMGLLGLQRSVYLLPIAILPIMVTVLFDAEVSLLSTIVLAMLLGILHRFDFTITLMTVVVGTAATFSSRYVRRRAHWYRIMVSVVATYVVFVFLMENLKLSPDKEVLVQMGYGFLAGMVSALLTIGILPVFESLFSITTDITLLELSDLNHPILKRLAMEAPGTYHHSISVGNLSEAAAKAIYANSLLARVGAYYHDIGKIEIPEYFVENQLGVKSRHEALSPSMSALILAAHVKRGRLLGEEADVPDDVLDFIEEHHGTMVMKYFYNKAVEQGADESALSKFRYPGPKPQSRETGIAMLADAVEAASRTLDDPKPARIHSLIQRIINERFQSGELDECPLTLRDLAKIREAFEQILIGAFHQRVEYPRKE